ncbi:MAG: hypothetical protein LBD41_07175 [Clostridiales Family XIII bacterium]|jgi:hypothetical protein|nr:hypothetical protein [Clostridiales Family XIII bacterium]
MLPLNYAVLKYFISHKEGDSDSVMAELSPIYGKFRAFKKSSIIESLMTAKENGLLDETKVELKEKDNLKVFYKANDYGFSMIKNYIKG